MSQRAFSFDLLSSLVLVIGVFLGVLLVVPSPLPLGFSKGALAGLSVLVALGIFIIGRIRRGSLILPPMAIILSAWLLVIASALSVFSHGTPLSIAFFGNGLDVDTLGLLVLGAISLTLIALSLRTPKGFSLLSRSTFVFFGVLLISQIALFLLSLSGISVGVPTLLGTVNDFAIVLGAGVLGAMITLARGTFSGRTKTILTTFLVLGLVFLAASNVSSVWILLGIASLAIFFQGLGLLQKGRRRMVSDEDEEGVIAILGKEGGRESVSEEGKKDETSLLFPALVLILSFVFVFGSNTFGNAFASAFRLSETQIRPSWNATFDVARAVYAQNPLFGAGPTHFFLAWHNNKPQEIVNSIFWDTDFTLGVGVVPTKLVTDGLFGLLAWIIFFGAFLWFGIRALIRERQKTLGTFSLLAFLVSCYFLVMLLITVVSPVVFLLTFLSLGAFVAATRFGSQGRREWGIFFSRSPKFGFVIVFLLTLALVSVGGAIYLTVGQYVGTTFYNRALLAYQQGDLDVGNAELQQALAFVEKDSFYRLQAAAGIEAMNRIGRDTSLSAEVAQTRFQDALTRSVNAGVRATELNPGYYLNWLVLGNVYRTVVALNIPNAYDSALSAYTKAEELYPTYPGLHFVKAQLEVAKGDGPQALVSLNRALELKQNYTDAIFAKSQLEVQQGNLDAALQSAEAIVYFEPQNQAALYQVALLRSAKNDVGGAKAALTQALSVNPEFANARYILAILLAQEGNLQDSLTELQKIANLSSDNAGQLEAQIGALENGENPFPANILSLETPLPKEVIEE
jgi:tetratricopeptide (TPR) repeat protein